MMRDVLFAPSLLSADFLDVRSSIASLKGQHDWLHVDVKETVSRGGAGRAPHDRVSGQAS